MISMDAFGVLLSGMIGLFVLAFGFILVFVFYQRRLMSKDLQQQMLKNDYQKKLLQASIENQETERKRIAHDLHDEIGALLTTSRLYFNQLSPGQAEEQLQLVSSKMNLLFDEMMSNIRRISHDLRPVILENLGLVEAVESIGTRLNDSGIHFNFTHQFAFKMNPKAELIFYRIIQELVNNTVKHAQASEIQLSIDDKSDYLQLQYSDDGVSFANGAALNGLGLKSIESRLNLMEGSMEILKPEKGICFLMKFNKKKIAEYGEH